MIIFTISNTIKVSGNYRSLNSRLLYNYRLSYCQICACTKICKIARNLFKKPSLLHLVFHRILDKNGAGFLSQPPFFPPEKVTLINFFQQIVLYLCLVHICLINFKPLSAISQGLEYSRQTPIELAKSGSLRENASIVSQPR